MTSHHPTIKQKFDNNNNVAGVNVIEPVEAKHLALPPLSRSVGFGL